MDRFLGFDGGGTHTRAVLVSATGQVLGVGKAGPSNYHNVGVATAKENLLLAAREAWQRAGEPFAAASSAYLGLAGVKAWRDIAVMTSAAEEAGLAPAGNIAVGNDLENALAGGLNGAPGLALIAGTGCNCLGQDETGKSFMCGGWGWLLGDIGAGFGIAVEGLRKAVRAEDGRAKKTRLQEAVLAFWGINSADELLQVLYSGEWHPGTIAEFAPVVMRLASEGDEIAQEVLKNGATELAEIVAATARGLHFPDGPELVLLGGCLTENASYRAMVEEAIRKVVPAVKLRSPVHDTLYGAALNVLLGAGKKVAIKFPK